MKPTVETEKHIIEKELQYSYIIDRWLPDNTDYEPRSHERGSWLVLP